VLNISGISSFAGTYGGNYNFTHSTIANYWGNSFRQFPALLLNNFIIDAENNVFTNPLESANFTNCIIYGNDNPELLLEKEPSDVFNFKFTNSLIYFDDPTGFYSESQYDFSNTDHYENVMFNNDPQFRSFYKPIEHSIWIACRRFWNCIWKLKRGHHKYHTHVPTRFRSL